MTKFVNTFVIMKTLRSSTNQHPLRNGYKNYNPQNLSELIGNVRLVRQLKEWLHSVQTYNAQLKTNKCLHENESVECPIPITFLYGSSGIGKTVMAQVILEHCNFHVYELNAGCIRSKKRIEDVITKIMGNQSVSIMRHCHQTIGILMDEVDGMSCGDKGGLHELFRIVQEQQNTKVLFILSFVSGIDRMRRNCLETSTGVSSKETFESEIIKRLRYICDCDL